MPPISRRAALAALTLLVACAASPRGASASPKPDAESFEIKGGTIGGAPFAVALPNGRWNHRLLLLAHGLRPEDAPLVPGLRPERPDTATLLRSGWMVAATAYRRNELIVADAIADLDALRARIAADYGNPEEILLEGEGMGGLIVTLMAERDAGPYAGAVAIDSTLGANESNMTVGLSLLPKIPLLLVATQRAFLASKGYVTALVARPAPAVPPVLFTIDREGRGNVNGEERLDALRALERWVDSGSAALPQPERGEAYVDATVPPDPGPSTVAMREDGTGFVARVIDVDAAEGRITLDAQDGDFAAVGIRLMNFFRLQAGGADYRTLYGRDFDSVRRGEWVALAGADGHTLLARNFADAAATARVKPGDSVTILRYEAAP